VDVRWVLDAALKLARHDIASRARLVCSYDDVPLVDANAPRLEQVFLNLLVNAAQAVAPGSPEDNEIRVTARTADDGQVSIEVSDTGVGVSPQHAGRIFDPFYTTKPPDEGMGLGLAICHGIVSGIGGRIELEPNPGGGSTFRVLLPPWSRQDT
jgi:signal transduction histidine kinase